MNWIKKLFGTRADATTTLQSDIREITKAEIIGARVTDVHSTSKDFGGYNCETIYFTVDRGFSFTMPTPGYVWQTELVPANAERIPYEYIVNCIKQRTIRGVYCYKMNEEIGFYEPDAAILLFDDGSRAYCISVAPNGIGTGLCYRMDVEKLPPISEYIDYFDIPLDQGSGRVAEAGEIPEQK